MNRKDTPTHLKTHRHKTMPNLSSMKIAILFFDWRLNVLYVGSDDRLFYFIKSFKLNVTHLFLEILVNVLSEGTNILDYLRTIALVSKITLFSNYCYGFDFVIRQNPC